MRSTTNMTIIFGTAVESMGPKESPIDLEQPELYEKNRAGLAELIEAAGGTVVCEVKEDGNRCQSHVDTAGRNKQTFLFTRGEQQLEPRCFPDIIDILNKLRLKQTILDGELKGLERGLAGLNVMHRRRRFAGISEKAIQTYIQDRVVEGNPLELVLFDVLMYKGKPTIELPYTERRKIVEDLTGKEIPHFRASQKYLLSTPEEIMALYAQKVTEEKNEGLVVKQPGLIYIPHDKTHWVKLKKFETLDFVVVGLYKNTVAKRTKFKYSKLMVAAYDPRTQKYQTLGNVNPVITNEATENLFAQDIEQHLAPRDISESPPLNLDVGKKNPELYVRPEKSVVLEISFMNIGVTDHGKYACNNNGTYFSLREAKIKSIRDDKRPDQASTPEDVAAMERKRRPV